MNKDLSTINKNDLPEVWGMESYEQIATNRCERIVEISKDKRNVEALKKYYSSNPISFIEDWCITYDPRLENPIMPFIPFPRQKDFLSWVSDRDKNREDGIVEKSRDMGATWLCVAYAVWCFLFKPSSKISFGSRKEIIVDRIGDSDSILEKARMTLRYLPDFFLPENFNQKRDLGFMKFQNRENGAMITGEAGTNIGRGGRSSIYFIDEAAYLNKPEQIEAALSQNSNCKIYVSTVNGPGNPFFRKRHSGEYPVFTFHWSQDPRKGKAWRDDQKRKLEPWVFAQEVEIDYHAALSGMCIPGAWVKAAQEIRDYLNIPMGEIGTAGLDVGASGTASSVLVMRYGPVVLMPRHWEGEDTTTTAMIAANLCKEKSIKRLNFDVIGIGHGVKATLKSEKEFYIFPVNVGDKPTNHAWPDGKRSRQKFSNLKSELWWRARDRFEKTFSTLRSLKGEEKCLRYRESDLIALPPGIYPLINQLSSVKAYTNQTGKIVIESKKELARRGVPSPDFADAFVLSLMPPIQIAYASKFKA